MASLDIDILLENKIDFVKYDLTIPKILKGMFLTTCICMRYIV